MFAHLTLKYKDICLSQEVLNFQQQKV